MRWLGALLVVAGCAAPHPAPVEGVPYRVVAAPTVERARPAKGFLALRLEEVFAAGEPVPARLVEEVERALGDAGSALIVVPHADHEHVYVMAWVAGALSLVFFERTGDGVQDVRVWPVPASALRR